MSRIEIDQSIKRTEADGFVYPLGVRPIAPKGATPGYTVEFESADGSSGSGESWAGEEWEEWPDRFMYDVLVPVTRLRSLCRVLFDILPGRVYPILDALGRDAYREIDPYLAYEPVGVEKLYDAVMQYGEWLFEDGLVGFGAMSLDPFFYVFIDEHKIVTIRAATDLKERVEKILAAFELKQVDKIESVDTVEHEHLNTLVAPPERPELLSGDDIIDRLREIWKLELNIDRQKNLDEEGNDLGTTPWICLVHCTGPEEGDPDRWAEVLLAAENLDAAERLAGEAIAREAPKEKEWLSLD
ncbi:MAG TPA: hypothetical protein VG797_02245, partial [Phycisphaerales bacterium]|nr:hypothetical protein [Phycisphaerales bacterium]